MSVSLDELKMFISPAGQQLLVDFVQRAREERGSGYIEHLKTQFPKFTRIFDLLNLSEAAALKQLKADYPLLYVAGIDNQLIDMHRRLNGELDKKR